MEFLVQPSLLSLLFPFSLFLYGLLVHPRPPRMFWELMLLYTATLITLKFVFQYPAFCICTTLSGQRYQLCSLSNEDSCSLTSLGVTIPNSRTDLQSIIGLEKISGGRDQAQSGEFMNFVGGVFLDLCTLFAIAFHRRFLRIHGLWLKQSQVETRKKHSRRS